MSLVVHPLEAEKKNIEVDWMAPSDGSGSIDREEFLQIPQIATNPLASRMIAIFDQEYETVFLLMLSLGLIIPALVAVEVPSTFKNSSAD